MGSPNGGERAETAGSFDVTDNTNDNHWWSLNNRNCLHNLALVHLGSWTVELADDMGHTSLVAHEGGQVDGFFRVILGERFDLSAVTSGTFTGKESERAVAGGFVLTVTHLGRVLRTEWAARFWPGPREGVQ